MATLSKSILDAIAIQLTEKSRKNAELLNLQERELVTTLFESTIPTAVMSLFKSDNYEYIETTSMVYISGFGFSGQNINLTRSVPAIQNYPDFNLKSGDAEKIMKCKRKSDKAKENYKTLLNETKSALYALKTHKNILENLPEAIPFLPPPMSNSLVVNFKSLQERLNKQPDTKELAVS